MNLYLLIERTKGAVHPRDGACGICHGVAEEIYELGGKIVAYEEPEGISALILDDQGLGGDIE